MPVSTYEFLDVAPAPTPSAAVLCAEVSGPPGGLRERRGIGGGCRSRMSKNRGVGCLNVETLNVYSLDIVNDSRDVPATELRSNLAAYLDEARAGGTVVVTRSGRPAARLVPPDLEEVSDE